MKVKVYYELLHWRWYYLQWGGVLLTNVVFRGKNSSKEMILELCIIVLSQEEEE